MGLVSSNSYRNGAGNLHHGALPLYRNSTRGLLDGRGRFVCGSLLRGMRRAKLGRRSGAQVAPSRAARPLFCIVRGQ